MCWSRHLSAWDTRSVESVRPPAPDVRVSDDDRQRVVALLSKHTGEGRLTLDEFEARVDEVWNAKKQSELQHTLRELPVPPAPTPRARRAEGVRVPRIVVVVALFLVASLLVGK